MNRFALVLILALATVFASGCNKPKAAPTPAAPSLPTAAQPRLQTMKLWLGAQVMIAELALTGEQMQAGMMFRTNMEPNEGMLFVFPWPHAASFWMKNTSLPLSAAYISPSGEILELHDFIPFNTNSVVAASSNIQFVLEAPRGWFQSNNIGTGAVVRTELGALSETFSFRRR